MNTEVNSVYLKPQGADSSSETDDLKKESSDVAEHQPAAKLQDRLPDDVTADSATPAAAEPRRPDANEALLDQEQRIERVWSDQDRKQYREKIREFEETVNDLRGRIEEIRTQCDSIWDHFVSLSLEMITRQKQILRKFLDDLQIEADILTPEILHTTNRIDTLLADIAGYQRLMGRKIGLLESMTHRISTQNHLNMMIARVAGLENHLLGRKNTESERRNLPSARKLEVNIPSDLLYLRIRLRTTRASMLAARSTKQVADTGPALYSLLFRAERMRSDLTVIATRMACLNDQAGYWLAYLDMPDDPQGP
jgi:hypothetical protein